MPTSPRYSLVSSELSSSTDDLDGNEELRLKYSSHERGRNLCSQCQQPAGSPGTSISFWVIIVSLLSICINCVIFLASSKIPGECIDPLMTVTNENIHLLRRPSPFIGMDNITRPVPPVYRDFVNFPQVIQQVNSERPNFVYDDDPLRYMSSRGLVSPEERRVQVTNSVSTLFQFRTVDYGMEKCELHVHFPVDASTNSTARPFLVSLHRLDSSLPLNTRTLSYSKKPRVTSTLVEIRVNPGSDQVVDWWQQFDCKWDQLFTFELACYDPERLGDDNCWLEWWQERKGENPVPAVYIKQISTV